MSISFVFGEVFFLCPLFNKMSVVVPHINVMTIKTIAITTQMFIEQNARPFVTTQFCTDEHGFSLHVFSSSNGYTSMLFSLTVKMTLEELLNDFPLK